MATEDEAIAEELQRAQQAHELLNNPLLLDIFDEYENELTAAWRNSEPRDAEGRERLWHRVGALYEFRSRLITAIEDGKLAAAQVRANAEK